MYILEHIIMNIIQILEAQSNDFQKAKKAQGLSQEVVCEKGTCILPFKMGLIAQYSKWTLIR